MTRIHEPLDAMLESEASTGQASGRATALPAADAEFRAGRVAELRSLIQAGRYTVPSERLADAILRQGDLARLCR